MGFSVLLSRVLKSVAKFNLLIVALLLISCGASVDQPKAPSGNAIPAKMLKFLNNGSWRVEMLILDSNNVEVHREEAQVNQETGYVQSGEFFLQPALDYRFIAVFYYKPDLTYELPMGMVVKFVDVGNEAKQVLWEESDIINLNSQIGLNILDKIPGQYLPNLDQDGDGYSNYHEAVAGSDGRDPSSIPNPPQLRGELTLKKQINSLDFELIFDDPLEVVSIRPVGNFTCGYFTWQISDTDPNNSDNTSKKLFAQFNLHAYDLGEQGKITLEVEVKNSLGLSKIYTFENLNFSKDANPDRWGPELYVRNPAVNEEVSDIFTLDIQACDENGIESIQPQNIGDASDLIEAPDVYTANVQTEFLKDGINEIAIKVAASQNNKKYQERVDPNFGRQFTHTVIVDNNNPIEIDPSPAEPQSDDIEIGAYVDFTKHPELKDTLKDIYVEKITRDGVEDGNFNALKDDKNSLPERYRGYLISSYFISGEATFTVTYRAETKTEILRRTVTYTIKNNPTIESFAVANNDYPFNPCFTDGETYFVWKVNNWGPTGTTYTGDLIAADGESKYVPNTDPKEWYGEALPEDKVEMDCTGNAENVHTLQAVRVGASQNGAIAQPFTVEKKLSVMPIDINPKFFETHAVGINNDIKYQIYSNGIDANQLANVKWRAMIWRTYDSLSKLNGNQDNPPLETVEGVGVDILLGTPQSLGLDPRGKYKLQVELLDQSDEKRIISRSHFYYFYVDEEGLLGWWRFDPKIDGNFTTQIVGFGGNSGSLSAWGPGYVVWEDNIQFPASGAVVNEDIDDYSFPSLSLNNVSLPNGFSLELLVKFNSLDGANGLPLLATKWGNFAMGYDANKKWQVVLAKKNIDDQTTCENMQQDPTKGLVKYAEANMGVYKSFDNSGPGPGIWTHLVYVYDPSKPNTANGGYKVELYVNGELKVKGNGFNDNLVYFGKCVYSATFGINIHGFLDQPKDNLKATIGELSFYGKPIDQTRIKALCGESYPDVACK